MGMRIAAIADAVFNQLPIDEYRTVSRGMINLQDQKVLTREINGITFNFYQTNEIRIEIKGPKHPGQDRHDWHLNEETLIIKLPDALVANYKSNPELKITDIIDLPGLPPLKVVRIGHNISDPEYTYIQFERRHFRAIECVHELNMREFAERNRIEVMQQNTKDDE